METKLLNQQKFTHFPGEMRSHHCGQLRQDHIGQKVQLSGWVNKSRDLGGLYFIDIRDKYGVTQLNFENFTGDLGLVKDAGIESLFKLKELCESGLLQHKMTICQQVESR